MEVDITYIEARKRYPAQVEEIVARVKKGKSKWVKMPLKKWLWKVSYALAGKSLGFKELLENAQVNAAKTENQHEEERKTRLTKSVKERYEDFARRIVCSLSAATAGCQIPSKPVPDEIKVAELPRIKAAFKKDKAELAKPKAQRDREAAEALRQLTGQPGFVAIRIQPK